MPVPTPARGARLADLARRETVGGALLLVATLIALVWANSAVASAYTTLGAYRIGPAALELDLTVAQWTSDGLLAIFFFVVGLELKHEIVAGDLRDPRRAALPLLAAVGGMVTPAIVFVAINLGGGDDVLQGWAIPTATDIAFALAVLAVVGRHLPTALRTFLLTLAVVDDLLAVTIIAIFYTADLDLALLAIALLPLAAFYLLVRRGITRWYALIPLALLTWGLVHASGVHATVAGVLLGFMVPALSAAENGSPAKRIEHLVRPVSSLVAVPVFAFFAAGVTVGGLDGLRDALTQPVTLGVGLGLVIGKVVGVLGVSFVATRLTRLELDPDLRWPDMFGLALLAGIGFTVSLLIGELAYGTGSGRDDLVKIGVLLGSLVSAVSAGLVLSVRGRRHRPTPAG